MEAAISASGRALLSAEIMRLDVCADGGDAVRQLLRRCPCQLRRVSRRQLQADKQ